MTGESNPTFTHSFDEAVEAVVASKGVAKQPTGHRATPQVKAELLVAATLLGVDSLQDMIDIAVHMYLGETARTIPGFADAVHSAQRYRDSLGDQP